ncbi:MAG: hypothetical protein ISR58_17645 [Anaerolineales bacterium]|nr:hypothetical protein [Chloroflexota bacterium]MBL6983001.1 hypothetical protein [Anaerolineales bacterium]
MKMRILFTAMITLILIAGCSGIQTSPEPIIGIDEPIIVGDAQLTVLDARIRNSMQTHYMMSYPQSGQIFYVITLEMERVNNDPDLVLDWGTNNFLLTDGKIFIPPANAQRTIAGDQAQYKVGEDLSFLYILLRGSPGCRFWSVFSSVFERSIHCAQFYCKIPRIH